MSSLVQLATDVALLAAAPEKTKGPEFGKAGPLGLMVIVALLAATFFLIRSMNKHVRNLPSSFDDEVPGQGDEAGGTDHAGIDEAEAGDGVAGPRGGDIDDSRGGDVDEARGDREDSR